jgi:predicted  nucleic acid-binding Zn-ribbon protein
MHACKHCGKLYEVKSIDDGCCSDDCWEAVNCEEPKPEEMMEEEFA